MQRGRDVVYSSRNRPRLVQLYHMCRHGRSFLATPGEPHLRDRISHFIGCPSNLLGSLHLFQGLYLHTLLVAAFLAEERLVRWLYALGWVLPAAVTALYAALRGSASEHSETAECWIHDSRYTVVLVAPVCASMVISLLFLCNIVRVLVIKLRAGPRVGARPSRSVLQAVRATLLLLPLLGLHYLLTPFRPEEKASPGWQQGYEVLSAITASFQGLCVAILFCFCNGEVIGQVKRKWQQHVAQFRPRANSCTATTVSFVRSTAAPLPGEEKV
ncbi:hypothetical protein B566_EDAN002485 [Ephemera danica]|nr:hypothetical protein B566_EDAN002485 [Ephemera danica]